MRPVQTPRDRATDERPASTTRSHVADQVADDRLPIELQRQDTAIREAASKRSTQVPDRRRSDPAVITVDEAAALLRVDRKSIYESIRRGELPGVVRVGRAIRISRTALLQWLSGQGRVSRSGATR
jgi:excisionase family DNA binding protein